MKKSDLNKRLQLEVNFLTRFLKDKGVYPAYTRYLGDKKVTNGYTIDSNGKHNDIFEIISKNETTRGIISFMINWSKTKEGPEFWRELNTKYNNSLSNREYYYEGRY